MGMATTMTRKKPTYRHTEQEAFQKLAALCAKAEHCKADMRKKMEKWILDEDSEANHEAKCRVVERLVKENYIDEQRYAHAYVREKIRCFRWGRVRILQELHKRGIAEDIIRETIEEVFANEDITGTLRQLITRKRSTIRGNSEYEINGKLIRFALSRGYDMETIRKVIHTPDDYD